MVIVKKANAEYRVHDEKLDEYLAMGYSQINEYGKVIREPQKRGEAALQGKVSQFQAENIRLNKENTALHARIATFEEENATITEKYAALQEKIALLEKEISEKSNEAENMPQKITKAGKKEAS